MSFITSALGKDHQAEGHLPRGLFEGWLHADIVDGDAKGKGKKKAVQRDAGVDVMGEVGWAVGGYDDTEGKDGVWEIGRLGGDGEVSNDDTVAEVLSVSRVTFGKSCALANGDQQLYLQLHPLMLSSFLESAPTAFSPSQTSLTPAAADDVSLELCTVTASLTERLAHAVLSRQSASASPSPLIKEVRSTASDFLRRMSAYFPFHSPRPSSRTSPNGLTPELELSLSYANLAVLLAPAPIPLSYPLGFKRDIGWKERVRAIETAWKSMREQSRNESKGKGKKIEGWALDEVAEWIVNILVSILRRRE